MPSYPLMPEEESQRVLCEIRKVFVEVWDPIGVMDDPPWPRDEYDGYIGRTFELLVTGGGDDEIIDHRVWSVDRMGMDASRTSLEDVVEALRAIRLYQKPAES